MNKRLRTLGSRNAVIGYLFISPFILGFLVFMVRPLFQSFYMSLNEVTVSTKGFGMELNNFYNYIKAFTIDPQFNRMLTEAVSSMLYRSLATMVFSFFVAIILNQSFKGRTFVRAIFFLPVILSSGVMVGLEFNNSLLNSMREAIEESAGTSSITGVLEEILTAGGTVLNDRIFKTVFEIVDSIYHIAMASGIQIIIFLSGLQNISPSMYEAAEIEGCSKWESLWTITFPMISPLLLVNWIYTIIDFFMKTDNEIMEKIRNVMIINLDYGYSSALAWIYFGMVMLLIGISSFIISKGVYYYE